MRYNNPPPSSPMDGLRGFLTRGGIPVTLTLVGISVALFLAMFFTSGAISPFLVENVAFSPGMALRTPWTLLTYPVFPADFFGMLIGGFFFWLVGGSLERSWGSTRFATFFFALTAITAVSLELGWFLMGRQIIPPLFGFYLPLSGLIVAFCMLNPEQSVMFFFFPIKAKYVALIVTLLTYFTAGMNPILNVFALGGILAAFLYVRYARPWASMDSYGPPRRQGSSSGPDLRIYPAPKTRFSTRPPTTLDGSPVRRAAFDFAGRLRDFRERRRLERLWRNSGGSDPEREARDDEGRRR